MKKLMFLILTSALCVCMFTTSSAMGTTSAGSARKANSEYATVQLDSVAAPSLSSGNMIIKLSLSKAICSRKMVNMQFQTIYMFSGLMLEDYPFSATELNTFYNLGLITTDCPNSLIYSIQYGCTSDNNLKNYDTGATLTPKDTVSGVNLYDVTQLQSSTPGPVTSLQCLAVQIHFDGCTIEFALKGDSLSDDRYNLAVDSNQTMIIRLKSGLLFPSGVMIKEDVTFKYLYEKGTWVNITNGDNSDQTYSDDTLKNQGGYTEEEIQQLKKAS